MGPGRRVRAAKCQMLVTCFFVLLLSLSVATMAALSHFGDHFTVISRASLERNPYEAVHRWVFYTGISLAGLLSLGAILSAAATMREAQCPLAMGFLCFALVFCSLVQAAFWRFHSPTRVEDAMLDTYDLVYDQAVRGPSSARRQELAAIQDTFLCCGKRSPFQLLGSRGADPCQGEKAAREDCLQSIRSFLKTQQNIASMLTSAGLALTVYAMLLSSFLWFAIHSGRGLDCRGKYTLTPRVDLLLDTPLKQRPLLAIRVQEDAWTTFIRSRAKDLIRPSPITHLPTEAKAPATGVTGSLRKLSSTLQVVGEGKERPARRNRGKPRGDSLPLQNGRGKDRGSRAAGENWGASQLAAHDCHCWPSPGQRSDSRGPNRRDLAPVSKEKQEMVKQDSSLTLRVVAWDADPGLSPVPPAA